MTSPNLVPSLLFHSSTYATLPTLLPSLLYTLYYLPLGRLSSASWLLPVPPPSALCASSPSSRLLPRLAVVFTSPASSLLNRPIPPTRPLSTQPAACRISSSSAKDARSVLSAASPRFVSVLSRVVSPANSVQLIERLSNYDVLQSRAFSIAMRRINSNAFAEYVSCFYTSGIHLHLHYYPQLLSSIICPSTPGQSHPKTPILTPRSTPAPRQFNTSRSSRAINDTSTVDFVYMPSMADLDAGPVRPTPKVPVLPDFYSHPPRTSLSDPPMRPQIYAVAGTGAEISASAMSEVVDNVAVDIDPFTLTEAVGRSRIGEELQRRQNGGAEEKKEPGVVRELWSGLLDDVFGPKESARK